MGGGELKGARGKTDVSHETFFVTDDTFHGGKSVL